MGSVPGCYSIRILISKGSSVISCLFSVNCLG